MQLSKVLGLALMLAMGGCSGDGAGLPGDTTARGETDANATAASDARPLIGGEPVEHSWVTPAQQKEISTHDFNTEDLIPISLEETRAMIAQAELENRPDPSGLKAGQLQLFSWDKTVNLNQLVIASRSQYICFLSGVSGIYRGSTYPYVVVGANPLNVNNIIVTKSLGGNAWVTCVPRSSFSAPSGHSPYQAEYEYNFIWQQYEEWGCNQRLTWYNYLGPEWAIMATGFGYDFNHGNDRFITEQSGTLGVSSKSWLEQTSGPCRAVGFTSSVFMRPSGLTRFRGPNGLGSIAVAGEWARSIQNSTYYVDTGLSTASNTCYFGGLAGNFGHDNDYVLLLPVAGTWRFYLGAVSPGGVSGRYRCVTNVQP